jgi:exonuclease III
MGMRFGTWNVSSLYRAGAMKTGASKLENYKLDLVAVQEVRLVEGGHQSEDDFMFIFGNENAIHHLGTGFFTIKKS